jgi:hypothetical protein
VPLPLWVKWVAFFVFSGLLGGSVLMIAKGTLPPPFHKIRVSPIAATTAFVLGMTGTLVFGDPDLLQNTINLMLGK